MDKCVRGAFGGRAARRRAARGARTERYMHVVDKNMNILNNSYLLVDTERICRNARSIIASLGEGTKLIPVLKDDAYGLGALAVAKALQRVEGVDCMAVAHISEAEELRLGGIENDILVMGYLLPGQEALAVSRGLTLACGRVDMVEVLSREAKAQGRRVKLQIKIDTGLHRIGAKPGEELAKVADALLSAGDSICVMGAFTHFADHEDAASMERQYRLFLEGVTQLEAAGIPVPMKHVSSSALSEYHPEYDMDAVRIGRRLYMDHPTAPLGNIEEVAAWRARITDVNLRRAGDTLGYGGKFRLPSDTLVATVGIGYGDGLNQLLVERQAPVLAGGRRCRLLACCMDQSFVDISGTDCQRGDEITLFGRDGAGNFLSSQEVALIAGDDEGCGLTSALSGRVRRVYI